MATVSSAAQSLGLSSKISVSAKSDGGGVYYTRTSASDSVTLSFSVSGIPAGSSINSCTLYWMQNSTTSYGGTTKVNNVEYTTGSYSVALGAISNASIPFYYKSRAVSSYGGSPASPVTQSISFSNVYIVVDYTSPTNPTVSGLKLSGSTSNQYADASAGVTLSWSASNGTNNPISSYTIQRSDNGGGWYNIATGVTSGSYTVYAHGSASVNSRFQVIAVAPYGNSAASASHLLYTRSAVSTPTGVGISPNTVFPNASVTLSWSASSGGTGTAVSSYTVIENGVVKSGVTGTSYSFAAPIQGSYAYTVQAVSNITGYNSAASTGASLTVDPPASNFELNRATVEMDGISVITATIDPINPAYNHDVTFALDATRTSTANVAAGSTQRTFTVPLAWCVGVPNATSATATCTVVTKNGTTVIGQLSTTFTVTIPASVVPGAALSLTPVDAFNGLYLKGKSKCTLTSTFTTAQGSTLSSQSLTGSGYSGTSSPFTTGVLNTVGANTMSATVTDSRSRQQTATQSITVTDYASPSILNVSAYRSDAAGNLLDTGSNIALTASFLVASIAGNSGTGTVRKRVAGGTWETSTAIAHNTKVVLTGALPENAYEVEITLTDTVGTVSTYSLTIRPAQFAFDFRNDRAALGRLATNAKTLSIPDDWTTNVNASKLNGASESTSATGNTIVKRDANGYIFCTYLNSNRGDETSGAASYIYDSGDGWLRKKTRGNASLELAYPVNSIYMSYSSTSPATLFGGTWSALPTGKFLRIGTGGTEGGSDTHLHSTAAVALTIAQMPSHNHRAKSPTTGTAGGVKSGFDVWRTGGAFNSDYMIENTGSGATHGHGNTGSASNVPAFYEVYAWRRTA